MIKRWKGFRFGVGRPRLLHPDAPGTCNETLGKSLFQPPLALGSEKKKRRSRVNQQECPFTPDIAQFWGSRKMFLFFLNFLHNENIYPFIIFIDKRVQRKAKSNLHFTCILSSQLCLQWSRLKLTAQGPRDTLPAPGTVVLIPGSADACLCLRSVS